MTEQLVYVDEVTIKFTKRITYKPVMAQDKRRPELQSVDHVEVEEGILAMEVYAGDYHIVIGPRNEGEIVVRGL